MLRGEKTTRKPPPSVRALLLRIVLEEMAMRFAPAASKQPPNVAVLFSHVMSCEIRIELLRTAMAPPLEEAELFRNEVNVIVSVDDPSMYSAPPPSLFEISQFSNVEEERIAVTLRRWSPRVPVCAEKCNEVRDTDSVREEPVIKTAA